MPSKAFSDHLQELLHDAEELNDAHEQLRSGDVGRQFGLASLNRAAVVMSISAWESYLEELMRECVVVLHPGPAPLGSWPALSGYVTSVLARFNTPHPQNVDRLIRDCLGLPAVQPFWKWQNCTATQASQRLADALDYRHQIAHGVHPRPVIHNIYSSSLPDFVRRLARCTDAAVRDHLATILHITNPWPA